MTDDARSPDVIAPIRRRSQLRAFGPEPPTDAQLDSVFAAAGLAPSAGNAQPWRFVLCRRGSPSFDALARALRSSNGWAAGAPVLVASAVRTLHVHPTKPPKENRLALFELGLATGNLLAQATALDLLARPVGGFDRAAARTALAIPDDWELGVLVALGRPADPEEAGSDARGATENRRERLDARQIVFVDRWGRGRSEPSATSAEPGPRDPGRSR